MLIALYTTDFVHADVFKNLFIKGIFSYWKYFIIIILSFLSYSLGENKLIQSWKLVALNK